MRVRPIHTAILAAAALLASPALAEQYPLPVLSAAAYSEASYEAEWSADGYREGDGEVIYMDELEDGQEWHSGDYDDRDYGNGDYEDYGERRDDRVVRREPAPLPPPRASEPAWGSDRQLAYGEGERHAWLAECRSRMSQGRDNGVDACSDYLARYESGAGGYSYDYSYGQTASHGCGSSCGGCGGGCGGGCNGGCGCTVSYRFAPMPMPVAQRRQTAARRIVTTEEWEEEVPGKTVRITPPPPVRTVRTKIVPVAPAPVKTIKPLYSQ